MYSLEKVITISPLNSELIHIFVLTYTLILSIFMDAYINMHIHAIYLWEYKNPIPDAQYSYKLYHREKVLHLDQMTGFEDCLKLSFYAIPLWLCLEVNGKDIVNCCIFN